MNFKRILFVLALLMLVFAIFADSSFAQLRAARDKVVGDTVKAAVVFKAKTYPLPTGPNAAGFFHDWRFGDPGVMIDTAGHTGSTYVTGGYIYTIDSVNYKATIDDTGAVKLPGVRTTTDSASFQQEAETILLSTTDGSTDDFIVYVSMNDTLLQWKIGIMEEEASTSNADAQQRLYFHHAGFAANCRTVTFIANNGTPDSIIVMKNDSTGRARGTAFNQGKWIQLRFTKHTDGSVSAYVNGLRKGGIAKASVPTTTRLTPMIVYKRTATSVPRVYGGYLAYIGYTHVFPDLQ